MKMKKIIMITLTIWVLVGMYILLDNNYKNAVQSCIEKGNDLNYCEYHASR